MEEMNIRNIILLIGLVIVVFASFMGAGENRKIIVFKDYDDLGLSFHAPVSYARILPQF
ncbi:hypothetical protein [Thiomicrorhabdus cannonii]|uniref:hypothetical protein n=1 Tax=Thiomicrorhabdus cannonii TaxID=2748011 RepID=UPI0015B8EF11|nr:hypothetical protein [Thiomicrorhabdus cannonii]